MFSTVLIANRGEIAVRITRTLRRLAIRSVVTYTGADAGSRATASADEAVLIGSYLSVDDVIGAALLSLPVAYLVSRLLGRIALPLVTRLSTGALQPLLSAAPAGAHAAP